MKQKRLFFLLLLSVMLPCIAAASETLKVWMDKSVSFTADGKTVTKLIFRESDPNINYIAFNMTLTVPKGVHINQVKSGRNYVNDIKLTERGETGTHTIACNMPDETTVRIICTSSLNDELYPDDAEGNLMDELFEIGFVADATTFNGIYSVEMTGCKFVQNDENDQIVGHILDHTEYCDFVVSGGTDFPGIDYTMSSSRLGTLIIPFDSKIPEGLSVYECLGVSDEGYIELGRVDSFTANTPYIVAGNPATYHLNGTYRGLKDSYSNDYMTGVYVESTVPEGSYVMQKQATDGLAFYKVENDEIHISPNRCWLNAPAKSYACLKIDLGNVSSVENINNDEDIVDVYSFDGILLRSRVMMKDAVKHLPQGIYIINNKKYIVK